MNETRTDNLNPDQALAVNHSTGPLLVLAGAGSGKTKIITERIANLINNENVYPSNILAVTFTNKAANEMKERINRLISSQAKSLWIGTFHSVCLRILKIEIDNLPGFNRDFVIYDDGDQMKLLKQCMSKLNIPERTLDPKTVKFRIDNAKNEGSDPGDMGSGYIEEKVSKIYNLYRQEIRKSNALDFSDLLYLTVKLFNSNPEVLNKYQNKFSHILVDEYQDTNYLQYTIAKLLSAKHRNIFVVGDDNQSIYGWRGADITNILNFEKDFADARIIKLEQNYRSTKTILNAANKLISGNKYRHEKNLWTDNPDGERVTYYKAFDEKDESRFIRNQIQTETLSGDYSFKNIAVLFRTNHQSRSIEDDFLENNIPYKIIGGTGFYQRKEIKDVLAYLKLVANPLDEMSLKRIINVPTRGIGKTTVERLESIANDRDIPIFQAIKTAVNEKLLPGNALVKIENFYKTIDGLIEYSKEHDIGDIINTILANTLYGELLERDEERLENVGELFNLAEEFEKDQNDSLVGFLDRISLISDIDSLDEQVERVSLLTLHSAKGLEFPIVFIAGMEENLLPHKRAIKDGDHEIEEERRLCYVGITRAKEKVYLTSAFLRNEFGTNSEQTPSRFISELPEDLLHRHAHRHKSYSKPAQAAKRRTASVRAGESKNKSGGNHRVGQKISHTVFGEGIIKDVQGTGDKARVSVLFPGHGIKKIIASYLAK